MFIASGSCWSSFPDNISITLAGCSASATKTATQSSPGVAAYTNHYGLNGSSLGLVLFQLSCASLLKDAFLFGELSIGGASSYG